jgi:hypothetical protein
MPFYLHKQYMTTVHHSYHSIVMSSLIKAQTSPLFTTLNCDVRMMLYDLLLDVDLPRLWDGSKETSYLGLYLSCKQVKDVTCFDADSWSAGWIYTRVIDVIQELDKSALHYLAPLIEELSSAVSRMHKATITLNPTVSFHNGPVGLRTLRLEIPPSLFNFQRQKSRFFHFRSGRGYTTFWAMLLQKPFDKVTFYVTSACAYGAFSAYPQTTAEDMTMIVQTFQTRLKKFAHAAASAWLAGQADAGIAKAKCRHGPIMTKHIAFAWDFTSTAAAASASDVIKTANSPSALPAGPISKMTGAKFKYTKEHLESLWFKKYNARARVRRSMATSLRRGYCWRMDGGGGYGAPATLELRRR